MVEAQQNTHSSIPGNGSWPSQARLYSGLTLFFFAFTHLINHALGLISIDVMDGFQIIRTTIWRTIPGTVLLYGAFIIHIVLALYKVTGQRTWRIGFWPAVQLMFGLAIPVLLFRHVLGTRMPASLFGVNDSYSDYALWVMWPAEVYRQAILIGLVWVHSCIGIHFWLRLRPFYQRFQWALYGIAVLVPVLAFAGFAVAGRAVRVGGKFQNPFTAEQFTFIINVMDGVFWAFLVVLGLVFLIRMARLILDRIRPRIKVTYAGGQSVVSEIGPTLLEISRTYGIPHASVCGGRARCSTCRVRVLDGHETLPEAGDTELKVLERVGAGANVRLACQLAPQADLSVAMLLPAKRVVPGDVAQQDKYVWGVEQDVTIMFADIRGFTSLSENRLPFDVVFLLNQFLGQMGTAIEDAGGYVDKFLGDGIMAIFGMEQTTEQGARNALNAAKAMGGVLSALNKSLASDLPGELNIGIGINTGPAILGRVGDAGQAQSTQRITALGDTVNTASRLESASKEFGVQLVISARTARACGLDIQPEQTKDIKVKGKENQISVMTYQRAVDAPTK